jgi:3-methyladenine DNA glycosylase AlkD
MNAKQIKELFIKHANKQKAKENSAYLRNLFTHFGIPAPKRRELLKPLWDKKTETIDWDFVFDCWKAKEREMQYTALDYLFRKKEQLTKADIKRIKQLAQDKSWWDTIDGMCHLVGEIALRDDSVKQIMLDWSTHEDFWLRRIAIQHQLSLKTKTDTELFSTIITNNFGQTEFFINKGIGWALREYSKTNPDWVRQFIEDNKDKMAKLSIREGSKHLAKGKGLPG